VWQFSAETLSILIIEVLVAAIVLGISTWWPPFPSLPRCL